MKCPHCGKIINLPHSHKGRHGVCGDCGRQGTHTEDDFNPSGPSPFRAINYYTCSCGNYWSEVELAT